MNLSYGYLYLGNYFENVNSIDLMIYCWTKSMELGNLEAIFNLGFYYLEMNDNVKMFKYFNIILDYSNKLLLPSNIKFIEPNDNNNEIISATNKIKYLFERDILQVK